MRPRIAVVGAGVSGISAAYRLRNDADVTLFEANQTAGGHAHTVEITDAGRTIGLDTAFIVFNPEHYPLIANFFAELGVSTQHHPGQFCFFDRDRQRSYVSDDLELDVEQVRDKYDSEFLTLHQEAARFYRESPRHFLRKQADIPLGEYLDRNGYSEAFKYGFIVLIATAAWSVPKERIWQMPASTIIAFYMAHGGEGLGGRRAPWLTVTGGSISYVRRAIEEIERAGGKVRLNSPVMAVTQDALGVQVDTSTDSPRFDYVI
ncbi:MAG TPA: FAD-dependent oxidoreductase, partial [Micromonosporaceae bacterium]|nr:FAD-dependent oxidoreductase [Micromonosporaceae bacterium]